jgi:N-acetylglucosaminyltransferase
VSSAVARVLAIVAATSVGLYAGLTVTYLLLQARFATTGSRRRAGAAATPVARLPSVDVIVPCFNEEPQALAACLDAIALQDYGGPLQSHVVDDGSDNWDELRPICEEHASCSVARIHRLAVNRGKRHAQVVAIRESEGDLILNVDSDTVIAPNAVRVLVNAMSDSRVGAAMAQVAASNAGATQLSRLVQLRYWLACNQERAAQSCFGAVLCCCGACTVYRRSVVEEVLDHYAGDGKLHGEDRHLTSLVLQAGMRTCYVPEALASTVVPERIGAYVQQQLRWNRSVYREMPKILPTAARLHAFLALDVIAQLAGPLLLAISLASGAVSAVVAGAAPPIWYLLTVACLGLAHCLYGTWRTRSLGFLAFLAYGVIHVALALSVRPYALCSLSTTKWGGRRKPPTNRRGPRRARRRHVLFWPGTPTVSRGASCMTNVSGEAAATTWACATVRTGEWAGGAGVGTPPGRTRPAPESVALGSNGGHPGWLTADRQALWCAPTITLPPGR